MLILFHYSIKYIYNQQQFLQRQNMKTYNNKQNRNNNQQYQSFTKLLSTVNLTNLDEVQLRALKQQHGYLEKLRQQRIKIEDIKKKYEDMEGMYHSVVEENQKLCVIIDEKSAIIQELESKLDQQIGKMENLEKIVKKQNQSDRHRNKNRQREIQIENQELRKNIKHKQLMFMTLQEQFNEKIRKCKEAYTIQKKNIIAEFQHTIRQNKQKNTQGELIELRNLVSRQNKALKAQNQKYQELMNKNESMCEQIQWFETEMSHKTKQIQLYQEKVEQLTEELESIQERYQQQHQNTKFKNQLDEIRKRVTDMTKGQIQKIQFIVNQSD